MFPPEFDYYRATTVEEALDRLASHADDDPAVLAGGHGLIPAMKTGRSTPGIAAQGVGTHTADGSGRMMNQRARDRRAESPGVLVDITGIDALGGIDVDAASDDDATVSVGPLTTHAELAASAVLDEHVPVLSAAARHVGDIQVRNRGTIGGNLVDADPAADIPAAVVAARGDLSVRGPTGERTIPADEFFHGAHDTALAADELVTGIRFPTGSSSGRERVGGYARKTHPATGYAMVGVAAVVDVTDGELTEARIAATGVQSRPVRLDAVEDALSGVETDDSAAIERATDRAAASLDEADVIADTHASAAYRRRLLSPYTSRAIANALDGQNRDSATPGTGGDAG